MRSKNSNAGNAIKLLLPTDLDIKNIIDQNNPLSLDRADILKYFTYLTYFIPATSKDHLKKDGYVPFSSEALNYITHDYRKYLDLLVANKILDEIRFYTEARCRWFRLADKFLTSKLVEVEITDKALVRQIKKYRKPDLKAEKKYNNLHRWFNENLQIDVAGAQQKCFETLQNEKLKDYYEAFVKANTKFLKIKMLAEQDFWFRTDATGHRLHTNFTNLDKDLKPFITYMGKYLVAIDIKNSQPFFSLLVLKERKKEFFTINPIYNPNNNLNHQSNQYNTIMFTDLIKQHEYQSLMNYMADVTEGKLYDKFEWVIRQELGDAFFSSDYFCPVNRKWISGLEPRARVKLHIFEILFSKNETNSQLKELFGSIYPTVYNEFVKIKGNMSLKKDKRHCALAQKLQRAESKIMLDKVVPAITKAHPFVPLFTIHDSIVTTVGNEGIVYSIMEKIITEQAGFKPTLDIQYWHKDLEANKKAA